MAGRRVIIRSAHDEKWTQCKRVSAGREIRLDSLCRAAHQWLTMNIEAGVQDDADAKRRPDFVE